MLRQWMMARAMIVMAMLLCYFVAMVVTDETIVLVMPGADAIATDSSLSDANTAGQCSHAGVGATTLEPSIAAGSIGSSQWGSTTPREAQHFLRHMDDAQAYDALGLGSGSLRRRRLAQNVEQVLAGDPVRTDIVMGSVDNSLSTTVALGSFGMESEREHFFTFGNITDAGHSFMVEISPMPGGMRNTLYYSTRGNVAGISDMHYMLGVDLNLCASVQGMMYNLTIICAEMAPQSPVWDPHTQQWSNDNDTSSSHWQLNSALPPTRPWAVVCRKPQTFKWQIVAARSVAVPIALTVAQPKRMMSTQISGVSHRYLVQVPDDWDNFHNPRLSVQVFSHDAVQAEDAQSDEVLSVAFVGPRAVCPRGSETPRHSVRLQATTVASTAAASLTTDMLLLADLPFTKLFPGNYLLVQIDWTPSYLRNYDVVFEVTNVPDDDGASALSPLAMVIMACAVTACFSCIFMFTIMSYCVSNGPPPVPPRRGELSNLVDHDDDDEVVRDDARADRSSRSSMSAPVAAAISASAAASTAASSAAASARVLAVAPPMPANANAPLTLTGPPSSVTTDMKSPSSSPSLTISPAPAERHRPATINATASSAATGTRQLALGDA